MLAWITYYGVSLAALKRAHIGFDGFLLTLPRAARYPAAIAAELVVAAFFVLLAYSGWAVLDALRGMNLISLPWVPVALTQSVIPISAVLFLVCQALSLPGYFGRVRAGVSGEQVEIVEAALGHANGGHAGGDRAKGVPRP